MQRIKTFAFNMGKPGTSGARTMGGAIGWLDEKVNDFLLNLAVTEHSSFEIVSVDDNILETDEGIILKE
jgi:hypothetical protein